MVSESEGEALGFQASRLLGFQASKFQASSLCSKLSELGRITFGIGDSTAVWSDHSRERYGISRPVAALMDLAAFVAERGGLSEDIASSHRPCSAGQ